MHRNNVFILYIFVTSDTPDLYINIIGYCIEHYPVTKITFVGIVEDRGQRERVRTSLSNIRERIRQQLTLLQQGEYLYRDQKTSEWQQRTLEIENYDKLRYSKIAEHDIDIQVITYDSLDEELSNYINSGECMFDVSGVLKGYLIDVYTLLLIKKVENIYVFELRLPRRTYDDKELIHNLSYDRRDYEYVNATRSKYTTGTIIKSREQDEIDNLRINSVNKLMETVAEQFARNTLIIYAVIVAAVIIWSTLYVLQGNWDKLEPWTFIVLALLPYFGSIIVHIFFRKEMSFEPSVLYDWLKSFRLRSLQSISTVKESN